MRHYTSVIPRSPRATAPVAEAHVFRSTIGAHLFVADGSRIYDVAPDVADEVEGILASGAARDGLSDDELWAALGLFSAGALPRYIDGRPLDPPPLYSISLNVAQACNMSCGYCYVDTGKFGGRARLMRFDVARAAVDRLIAESAPGADLVLGYMGGKPLLNRPLIHATTRYAAQAAAVAGRRIRFAMTTNATMLQPADARLFAEFPFALALSIDGAREAHDAVRRMNDGSSSVSG